MLLHRDVTAEKILERFSKSAKKKEEKKKKKRGNLDYTPPSLLVFFRTPLQGKKELEVKIASLDNVRLKAKGPQFTPSDWTWCCTAPPD